MLQDTDGFVIPSLGIEDPDRNKIDSPNVEEDIKLSVQVMRNLYPVDGDFRI